MEILKRTHSEAFLQKMRPVFVFNEFYTKTPCLISEGILEAQDQPDKFALVRVFIDLSVGGNQPYIIFINKTKEMVVLDLVSYPGAIEKIAETHEKISSGHLIYGVGSLDVISKSVRLGEKRKDHFVASLLWATDLESNLKPGTGLSLVKQFLCPDC
jgi:hypothetical protein